MNGYDGIIIKDTTYDNGIFETDKEKNTQYVAFYPEQIKNVDNTNPTTNSDIRYSQSNKSWSKYLKEYWDLMPNAKKTFSLPTAENLKTFDKEQSKKTYESLHMKNESENDGMKERSFVKNANTTSWIPEEFKGITGEYTPISNAETLAKAHERINNEDYQSVKDSFLANDLRDATDTAIGELLMQKAINDKNYKDYNTITCALAEKLTRAGQAIQAASILKRLTPDGMIMYAQKQLKNARIAIEKENKKLYEELKEKGELPELNEEDTKFIYEKMEKANELDTSNYWGKENRQKEILIGQALARIANKIPSTALDIVAGIRRNGLLFNLKTLKRNVGSNLAFSLQEAIKDIPATVADEITSFFTGKRTTKLPNISAYWKGIKKGSVEAVEDVKYGISTAGGGSKYELPSKVFKRTDTWSDILQKYKNGEIKEGTEKTFKRLLSDYEDTAMFIVEGTDRPFWQGRFESELANQMQLNGLEYGKDIPTEEMLEMAKESADYATFKNENKVSRFLGNTRNLLNNGKAIGVADALGLTFTNVPGSVASKAYDYSPFGLTKVLTEIKNLATKNGKFNQRKFVDAIGRVITGTGLGALGVFLLKKGIIYGSYDDDKDVANMQKQMGIQENSINVSALKRLIKGEDTSLQQGDEFYNIDWLQPSASSIAVGTDIYNSIKNGDSAFDTTLKAAGSVIEQVQDMSALGTFSDLFGGYGDNLAENIVNTALDFPSSFAPTIFNNISQYSDNISRNTYDATSMKNTMLNKIRARIPSEKSKLAPNVNTLGEEMKTYENPSLHNTFSNPGYNTKYSATPVQEEIMKVYKDTSDRTIFPRKAENTITYQDTKVTLDPYQKATYQKAMGSYTNEQYSALLDSEFYNSLESEDKAEIMRKILDDATVIGKASVGVETKNYLEYKEDAEALDEAGIPLIDYYNAWFAKKEAEDKKKAQISAINKAVSDDLTVSQRKQLYKILNVD